MNGSESRFAGLEMSSFGTGSEATPGTSLVGLVCLVYLVNPKHHGVYCVIESYRQRVIGSILNCGIGIECKVLVR